MWLKNLFKPKVIEKIVYKEPEIRDNWFVWESGQNPLCCYWYCTLCSFTFKDKEGRCLTVSVEDCETFNEAIELANKKAEEKEKCLEYINKVYGNVGN